MKKGLLLIAAMALFTVQAIGQLTGPLAATFNWIDDAPTIDGVADEGVWADAAVTTLVPEAPFKTEVPTLTDPTVKAFWNDTALFVFLETSDGDWWPTWMTTVQEWESDKYEVYIDVNADIVDGGGAGGGAGNYQFAPQFQETAMGELIVWTSGNGNGMTAADNYDGAGYWAMEYSFAWADMLTSDGVGFDPYSQETFGFDVTFIDCDAETGPRNRLIWSNDGNHSGMDESWNTMDGVGVITLATGSAVQLKKVDGLTITPTVINNGYFNVSGQFTSVEIYNTIGQLVKSVNTPGNSVSVAELQTGIHFVKVKNDSKESVTKILIK